jgi:alpha-amylase
MEQWSPEVLRSFQQLVDTGRVELVAETYYHSLSFFYSLEEFEHQVEIHTKKLKQLFGYKPKSFRNTELAYNNELAQRADAKGYKAILTEGWEPVLEWRSPNHVYRPAYTNQIRLLMKNYRLSDDIAFRFGNRGWGEWPLTAEKFVHWLDALDPAEDVINLFMDYETFGEHQWDDTGIFNFLEEMPAAFLRNPDNSFVTVTEAAKRFKAKDYIDVPSTITWADTERDLSAWLGNAMQQSALQQLYSLEADVMATRDIGIVGDWRKLTASDHFYYMCTKWFSDGDIHAYFSPYESPYDAYIFTTNALRDLRVRVDQALAAQAAGPKPRGRRPKSLSGRR